MARGATLGSIRQRLMVEIGASLASSNIQDYIALNLVLSSRQFMFAMEFDWPFLEQRWDLPLSAGQRFYPLPTQTTPVNGVSETANVNFDRDVDVAVLYNQLYQPVLYGIGTDEYNVVNPEIGIGSPMDPVQKWRMASNVDEQMEGDNVIEVWPPPATNYPVRFTGKRQVYELFPASAVQPYLANTANYLGSGQNAQTYCDAQTADLDDLLLIHTVAAEKLAKLNQQNAQIQAGLAARRLQILRATSPSRSDFPIIFGKNKTDQKPYRQVPMVVVHG